MRPINPRYYEEAILQYLRTHDGKAKNVTQIMKASLVTNFRDRYTAALEKLLREQQVERKGREIILKENKVNNILRGMGSTELGAEIQKDILEATKEPTNTALGKTAIDAIQNMAAKKTDYDELTRLTGSFHELFDNSEIMKEGLIFALIKGELDRGKSPEEVKENLAKQVDKFIRFEPKLKKFFEKKRPIGDVFELAGK